MDKKQKSKRKKGTLYFLLLFALLILPLANATTFSQPASGSSHIQGEPFTFIATPTQGATWMQVIYTLGTTNTTLFNNSIAKATTTWSNVSNMPNTLGTYKFFVRFNGTATTNPRVKNTNIGLSQFQASDIGHIAIDGIAIFLVAIIAFAAIIALIWAYKFAKKSIK